MYSINNSGWLEVICGSMFASKSTELIQRIEKCDIANESYKVFKPTIDDRYLEDRIATHSGLKISAITVNNAEDILDHVYEEIDVVAIDEAQFFSNKLINVIDKLKDKHIRVIVSGLDTDFRGEPFNPVPQLLAKAEFVDKMYGVCEVCGELGTKTQRIINGKPAHYEDATIVVGADESYECRCNNCHTIRRD